MNSYQVKEEIEGVKCTNALFNKYKSQGATFVEKLKNVFLANEIQVNTITQNSFDFNFWGLTFITVTEITFDFPTNNFKQGELNTYLKKEDELELIMTYGFDSIGNIGNGFLGNDFSSFYYIEFVNHIKKKSSDENLKFQLV